MRQLRITLLTSIFCVAAAGCLAQTSIITGLRKSIILSASPEEKLKNIFALCEVGYSLHPDTLMSYATRAGSIATQSKSLKDEVRALYFKTLALTTKGLIDSSLKLAEQGLQILSGKVNDPVLQAQFYNQKGRCFMRKNQYKEAIEMGYMTIAKGEQTKDVLLQIKGKTLIGWAYLEMGQLQQALAWHLKALHTTADSLVLQKYAILYANLALNYNGIGKTDSAFYFISKAVQFSRKHENLFALSNSLAIKAQLLVRLGQAGKAEMLLKEVIVIRKLIGDPFYIVSDMSQLGLYYAHNGQPVKGIALCKEGIEIATHYKLETKLLFLYSSLAENYKASANASGYAATLETIIRLKDSVYQKNSEQAVAEMQTKFEKEKDNNIIMQQKLALVKKNYWLYGSIGLMLFVIAAFIFLFNIYRKKQFLKSELLLKEEKYSTAQAVALAEENERKRIAADLHDNIGSYASAIRADVEKITNNKPEANGAHLLNLQTHSQEIINSLRDTIWVLNKEIITITGISDRIKNYINKLAPSFDQVQFHIKEDIQTDVRLRSQNALNIFRIVQEAIHNALKHSGAAIITVGIVSKEEVTITVVDDGTGINDSRVIEGMGLLNMQARAKEIGMKLCIVPGSNAGTVLTLATCTTN